MGFREFITNFRYRRQLQTELEHYLNIKPPANPSRRYINKLVRRLLKEHTAGAAHRELSMIGEGAIPVLIDAVNDPRFHRAEWEDFSSEPVPLDATLELLVGYHRDEVVKVALPLVKSPSAEVRKTAALHLATAGRSDTIPVLQQLMADDDHYVRSYVRMGIHRAVTKGRPDADFPHQAYDLLLSQCDQRWRDATNDVADTLVVIDSARAAIDFSGERYLTLGNPNLHRILDAGTSAAILLPEDIVRRLLYEALPLAMGERSYPSDYVVAAALRALAARRADGVGALAESLLTSANEQIKTAAAEVVATIAGLADPVAFVMERVNSTGYETLSREQRVVYCAFSFDAEVCNGGLMQFFGNTSGDLVVDTLAALEELKHEEALTALRTAVKLAGPLAKEPEREVRLTCFDGRWDELQPAFDQLETAYYATSANLRQAWMLYAVRHAAHFRA